jgi:hypothetical protein
MTFCFMTFLDRKFSFSYGTFIHYAMRALDYEEIDIPADSLYKDLNDNICIIHTEGDDVNFIHRSFQEYFAALFLSKRSVEQAYEFIDYLFSEANTDQFAGMLLEIDKEEFERKYLIEKLAKIDSQLSMASSLKDRSKVLTDTFVIGRLDVSKSDELFLVPVGMRIKAMAQPADGIVNNAVSLINHIGSFYNLSPFTTWEYAKADWRQCIPPKLIKNDRLEIVPTRNMPVKLLSACGIKPYLIYLSKELKRIRRDLDERHARKSKLLSDVLRRTTPAKRARQS